VKLPRSLHNSVNFTTSVSLLCVMQMKTMREFSVASCTFRLSQRKNMRSVIRKRRGKKGSDILEQVTFAFGQMKMEGLVVPSSGKENLA